VNTATREDLVAKAAEERARLHVSVEELKTCVRDNLDVNRQVRKHLEIACAAAALLGLMLGYSMTGAFVRD
jgi:hypothetical protein